MSYGVTQKNHRFVLISKYLKKQLSFAIGKIQISLNLKWYNFFCSFEQMTAKFVLLSKVALKLSNKSWGKNYVNYNFILNK